MKWILFLLFFRFIYAQDETQVSSDSEKQLLDELFKNYNKNILPPHNSTEPIVVETGISVINLNSIDLVEQTLNAESWLKLQWSDKRLVWDDNKYKISVIRLDVNSLWRPDITIHNSADARLIEFAETSRTRHALIYPSGLVVWIPATSLKVLCGLDMTYYPFDTHNCAIKVGSYRSDIDFNLYDNKKQIDLDDCHQNTEWTVVETKAERNVDKHDVHSNDVVYITFSLTIRRARPLYHAVALFPMAGGLLLAISAFLISPFDNKRICFNIFVLFLFIFLTFHLISLFPSVGRHTPVLVSICESLIILISLSIVWNVILQAVSGHFAKAKTTPFVQRFMSAWPIKLINQLCMDDKSLQINLNQMNANSNKADSEVDAIIVDQSGSTNEWQPFLSVLDKLAFFTFILLVVIILLAFSC